MHRQLTTLVVTVSKWLETLWNTIWNKFESINYIYALWWKPKTFIFTKLIARWLGWIPVRYTDIIQFSAYRWLFETTQKSYFHCKRAVITACTFITAKIKRRETHCRPPSLLEPSKSTSQSSITAHSNQYSRAWATTQDPYIHTWLSIKAWLTLAFICCTI